MQGCRGEEDKGKPPFLSSVFKKDTITTSTIHVVIIWYT